MAKSLVCRPWELDSGEDGNKCVSDSVSLRNTLVDNLSIIVKMLDLSNNFWTLLLQHSVVDTDTMRSIQAKKTPIIQAQALMVHMMEVQVYKFHGFIWALVNSHQCHLAELLGFAVRDYLDVEVYFMSSALLCPACHEFYTKAYILTGCGHYVCAPCVKGAQFMCKQNQKEDVTCPVPECGKVTEACPSAGNIGLKEDGAFGDLCQAVLNMTTKQTAESKGQEQDKLSQLLQGGISDLETKISCLHKYRDALQTCKPGVQDYITDTVEKFKKNMDMWAKERQEWYANIQQQVEENLHKSVKWQKAASELAVVVRTRPTLVGECLKNKINLPKDALTDEAQKLLTKQEAGCPIPYIINPRASVPPVQAKFLSAVEYMNCIKVAWMPDSSVMVLTGTGLWRTVLNLDTAHSHTTLIKTAKGNDMSVAADGTCLMSMSNGTIEIVYPGQMEVRHWRPEGVEKPHHVFINNNLIFVGGYNSPTIRSYSWGLLFGDQYDIGTSDNDGNILATERGTLLKSTEDKIYTMDLHTKEVSSFGSGNQGELSRPCDMDTVNGEDYLLVCDNRNNRVSVFTPGGQFIHHLDVEGGIEKPSSIAVLPQQGKPSLMALYGEINGRCGVNIYSLK